MKNRRLDKPLIIKFIVYFKDNCKTLLNKHDLALADMDAFSKEFISFKKKVDEDIFIHESFKTQLADIDFDTTSLKLHNEGRYFLKSILKNFLNQRRIDYSRDFKKFVKKLDRFYEQIDHLSFNIANMKIFK